MYNSLHTLVCSPSRLEFFGKILMFYVICSVGLLTDVGFTSLLGSKVEFEKYFALESMVELVTYLAFSSP